MRVEIEMDAAAVACRAADLVSAALRSNPHMVLGLAAGATPLALYAELARRNAQDGLDFSRATLFDLDEYLGLTEEDPRGFRQGLRAAFINKVGTSPGRVHLLGVADGEDPTAHCTAYEETILRAGGIDLQILGIGVNAHIAFNEPGSAHDSRTRPVTLSSTTRSALRPHFSCGDEVPRVAVTMGIGTILEARRLLLLATGLDKARAVTATVEGPVTEAVPASALRHHPDATILLDRAAASGLVCSDTKLPSPRA
ncbi:Glucosamine-6-phosphate deaminase [Candidatus Terasakiella magnetica]|nr:Glucosamine-6-phosphate deaminase [Candidatus Terasakiella magnetica]